MMTFEEIWQGCDPAQIDRRHLVGMVATLKKTGLRAVRDPRDPDAVRFEPAHLVLAGDTILSIDEAEKRRAIAQRCFNRFLRHYMSAIDLDQLAKRWSGDPLTDHQLQDINDTLALVEKQRVSEGKPAMWEMFAEALLGSDWREIMKGSPHPSGLAGSGEVKRA